MTLTFVCKSIYFKYHYGEDPCADSSASGAFSLYFARKFMVVIV